MSITVTMVVLHSLSDSFVQCLTLHLNFCHQRRVKEKRKATRLRSRLVHYCIFSYISTLRLPVTRRLFKLLLYMKKYIYLLALYYSTTGILKFKLKSIIKGACCSSPPSYRERVVGVPPEGPSSGH